MSLVVGQSLGLTLVGDGLSLRNSRRNGGNSKFLFVNRRRLARAALVQARPTKEDGAASRATTSAVVQYRRADLADDLQAEARALGRAVDASVYSPELIARKHGSQPLKVSYLLSFRIFEFCKNSDFITRKTKRGETERCISISDVGFAEKLGDIGSVGWFRPQIRD